MAKGKISAKQQEILDYIKTQILERGFPPSVREICEAVHLRSTSSVHSHLETLEKNGYIRCGMGKRIMRTETAATVSASIIGALQGWLE